jgi:hypothetical protein
MYSGVVNRTQIYLGDGELELLDRASRETGATRSELIRRAVRTTFGEQDKHQRVQAIRGSAGSWRGRRESGAEYVDALRRGRPDERLFRLGLK